MANEDHLKILKQGCEVWNKWRSDNFTKEPDLSGAFLFKAELSGANLGGAFLNEADLIGADLGGADLSGARLIGARLIGADLRGADLSGAYLLKADLRGADLIGADLSGAFLGEADLSKADLTGADLSGADLTSASLIKTIFEDANLEGCNIYGISAWDLKLDKANQLNLVITPHGEPPITVDDLEVAQFIYLLLNNRKIRNVIEIITSKAVLILGRFKPERKAVLDAIREELRKHDYLPILFDFEKPSTRNLTETVSTLAHMARFVIADLTDAKSIPQELQRIIPGSPSLPVQPIILSSQYEYAMFKDFLDYDWVLIPYRYDSIKELLASLETNVIEPAIAKAEEIENRRKAIEKEMARNVP